MHYFPYAIQSPVTKEQVTITDEDDLKELFLSYLDYTDSWATIFAFTQITICYYRFRDEWVNEMLERYDYCKEWHTAPYNGAFDDHPAVWKDVSGFIVETIHELRNCKCHEHDPKAGK